MDSLIAQLNIERFKTLLAKESDKTRQEMLRRLLAEQEAKFAAKVDPSVEIRAPMAARSGS